MKINNSFYWYTSINGYDILYVIYNSVVDWFFSEFGDNEPESTEIKDFSYEEVTKEKPEVNSKDRDLSDRKVELPSSSKESIGRLFGSKADFKDVRDNPNCPNLFHVKELKTVSDEKDANSDIENKLLTSNLILEIVHLLFCRQWKYIAFSKIPAVSELSESLPNDNE